MSTLNPNATKLSKSITNISNIEIKSVEALVLKRAEMGKFLKPIGLADTAVYHYVKEAGFFGKKEQRITFTFFQGLNTNPQNLSIFLRDMVQNFPKTTKQKLSKGQFLVYDIFNENDCVIEISIPGNFQIYKIRNGKKQLISNHQIDSMYVSSIVRAMYGRNLGWGKCYNLFGAKGILEEFRAFIAVFLRVVEKIDISISEDYQHKSSIKGSHSCSILFQYIKSKRIVHHSIEILQKQISNRGGYTEAYPKLLILLCQLYSHDGKYAKSLSIIGAMMKKFSNDPYLLFYQAKFMFQLMVVHQALLIVNSIVQFNQFQIWCLAAELHLELKNYGEALVCLNHASRIAGKSAKLGTKNVDIEALYGEFEKLGKKNFLAPEDQITQRPKLMSVSQNPLSIVSNVEEKYKSLVDNQYYRMGFGQKIVYNLLRALRYRLDAKKFQQLIGITFENSKKHHPVVNFKAGMTESMFVQAKNDIHQLQSKQENYKNEEDLPNFLKDQSVQMQVEEIAKGNRNLSIIPELESVIENSQFEQKQKQAHKMVPLKLKKQMNETLFKLIKAVLSQNQIQKAEFEQNWAKVLPVYNKLRTSSKINTFYAHKMFQIMMKIENHKSVLVLIAESLDAYEQLGSRKIQVLPFWMQKYIFEIIQEKGLKFLNGLLQKMNFFDEAVIDTIQLAKNWKIKGCTF